jgi:hypothetical protein
VGIAWLAGTEKLLAAEKGILHFVSSFFKRLLERQVRAVIAG